MNVYLSPFGAANDTELSMFPDSVQRAIFAYCTVYKASLADVVAVARLLMRRMGAAELEPYTWFQLIRDKPQLRLRLLQGGAS